MIQKNEIDDLNLYLNNISKNVDCSGIMSNSEFYKQTKEYMEFKIAIELFPDLFGSCKKNLYAKSENFLEKINSIYRDLAIQMYAKGYKEGNHVDEQLNKLIKFHY